MTPAEPSRTTFVIDRHVIQVEVDDADAPRSLAVTLFVDERRLRRFEEPGWRRLGFGGSSRTFFWWSARRLAALSFDGAAPTLQQIDADEDIVLAFPQPDGWLLVCETSLRLVVESEEVSRLDFGEVIAGAHFDGESIVVRTADRLIRRATRLEQRLESIA